MKKTLLLGGFLVISSIVFSQTKEEIANITFKEINIPCSFVSNGIHTARTSSEYKAIEFFRLESEACKKIKKPKIDFKNFALLGYRSITKGCSTPTVSKVLTKQNNTITVAVKVEISGTCKTEQEASFWCIIPKEFYTKKTRFEVDEQIVFPKE